jgi:hypothetical protein
VQTKPVVPPKPGRGSGHPLEHHEAAEAHHAAHALGWTPDSAAEREEEKLERDDEHAKEEQKEQNKKVQVTAKTATPAQEAQQAQQKLQKNAQRPSGRSDANQLRKDSPEEPQQQPPVKSMPVTDYAAITKMGATDAVTAAKTIDAAREAAERALRSGKPPDAFTLLNAAQPHGFFFLEDFEREGYSEEQEDPELRAAIEECIQLLFGVKGIIRVGPGRNQADEPVIVIVVGQGFGEGSLRAVPEKVHRFTTLLAVPFDVLPLKKER